MLKALEQVTISTFRSISLQLGQPLAKRVLGELSFEIQKQVCDRELAMFPFVVEQEKAQVVHVDKVELGGRIVSASLMNPVLGMISAVEEKKLSPI